MRPYPGMFFDEMERQRGALLAVRPCMGRRTWTVIDSGYRTVAPVEEWLEAHRHLWSPNTVRGYISGWQIPREVSGGQ